MSLENKIRELIETKKARSAQQLNEAGLTNVASEPQAMQGNSSRAQYTEIDPFSGDPKPEDNSRTKGGSEPQAMQGNSQKASYSELDPTNASGTTSDNSVKKGNSEPQAMQGNSRKAEVMTATGKGQNGTFQEPTTPGGVKAFEETDADEEVITEADLDEVEAAAPRKIDMNLEELRRDIASVFAADTNLSEEFKTQASAIFEAAVIARVNNEVEAITAELQEQNARDFDELKEGLVEKIDAYLNYVVEQWMQDNELAVESGLRTEVAEDFMTGLKNLFQEHYFEVPEDRVDVLEDMSQQVDQVTAELDEAVGVAVALKTELDNIKRDRIIEQACRDLTATDAEKMAKLLEGVEFDNETLFTEKVRVVKENYFPGVTPNSPERMLEEQVQRDPAATQTVPAHMSRYVEALSRTAKVKR